MLTRDLLRFAVKDGRIQPRWLGPTPAIRQLAEDLLAFWNQGCGTTRGDLEDQSNPILHRSRSLPVARGLQKLILDHCDFGAPDDASALRERAFAASALRLRQPTRDAGLHQAGVAADLGVANSELGTALYADLPDQAVLKSACPWTAERLIAAYNLALAQGLLLRARELRVTVHDADTGLRRKLLKALRWRRLLARVAGSDGGTLSLVVSGPDAVLDQGTRYGLNLAQWLPALACAQRWQADCDLPADRHGGAATLTLSDADGLAGENAFLGYVPEELQELRQRLATACPDWGFEDPDLLPLRDGEIVVPDLQFRIQGQTVRIECFHRWHAHAFERRLRQVASLPAQALLLGVDRSLAKTTAVAPLLEQPAFTSRGFLFSTMPTAQVLRRAIQHLIPAADTA